MRDPNPLLDTTRMLGEARRILDGVEATALGGVAQMLAETAESLARTARELKGISPDEWLTFEEAAAYLKKTPKAARSIRDSNATCRPGFWITVVLEEEV